MNKIKVIVRVRPFLESEEQEQRINTTIRVNEDANEIE